MADSIEELNEQLKQLQSQSRQLKLKAEITLLQQQIMNMEMTMPNTSTPATPAHATSGVRHGSLQLDPPVVTPIRPRHLRWQDSGLAVGDTELKKVTDTVNRRRLLLEDEVEGDLNPDSRPDRYVTKRRSKSPARTTMIKPATFDGTGSWLDYKAHFETCSEINCWSYKEKGLYLAVALRGQAQGVYGNLATKTKDYDSLVKALEERFAPPNQTELYRVQLRERKQRASESLSELGQEIRRLTNLAYASAPNDVRETLAKEQFIDALVSTDMRIRVQQARPRDLNDAIRHAVELEAFIRAEKRKLESEGVLNSAIETEAHRGADSNATSMHKLSQTVERLEQQMQSLLDGSTNRQSDNRRDNRRSCFECGSKSHFRRNCPKLRKSPKDNTKSGQDTKDAQQVNLSTRQDAGLLLQASFKGLALRCLVDTGATLSLMSQRVWNNHSSDKLDPYDGTVMSASGTPLDVQGKANIRLEIHGMKCDVHVVVADIENDMVVGLDFMQQNNCKIDVASETMTVQGKECRLANKGNIGCFLSLFSGPKRMPNTKTTVRKPEMVCPSCRSTVASQKFKYHVLMCVGEEYGCDVCMRTFKKKAYLQQHNKRAHEGADKTKLEDRGRTSPTATFTSPASTSAKSDVFADVSSESESEASGDDWDKEPDVELDYDTKMPDEDKQEQTAKIEPKTSQNSDDNRNVNIMSIPKEIDEGQRENSADGAEEKAVESSSIDLGRIIRKRTSPAPLAAPAKKREIEVKAKEKKVPVREGHKMEVKCRVDVNRKGQTTRNLLISKNEENVITYSGTGAGTLRLGLDEFMDNSVRLSPGDIKLEIVGGELNMSISYKE